MNQNVKNMSTDKKYANVSLGKNASSNSKVGENAIGSSTELAKQTELPQTTYNASQLVEFYEHSMGDKEVMVNAAEYMALKRFKTEMEKGSVRVNINDITYSNDTSRYSSYTEPTKTRQYQYLSPSGFEKFMAQELIDVNHNCKERVKKVEERAIEMVEEKNELIKKHSHEINSQLKKEKEVSDEYFANLSVWDFRRFRREYFATLKENKREQKRKERENGNN